MKPKLFKPSETPTVSNDDSSLSIDVVVIDSNGFTLVAYYNFETDQWRFYQSTLFDYNKDNETKWMWYYSPFNKFDVE